MKGFLYLVEIVVAGILVAVIMSGFFAAQGTGTTWDRADLVGLGNSMFDAFDMKIAYTLNDTSIFDDIRRLMTANVMYTLRFNGIPKNEILVGTNDASYVRGVLTDAYVNGRTIKFNVSEIGSTTNLDKFDVLVLEGYPDYTEERFAKYSKTIIGIEDASRSDIKTFFNLNDATTATGSITFNNYDDLTKYFCGFGFIVSTPNSGATGSNSEYGIWKFLNTNRIVNITSDSKASICDGSVTTCLATTSERGVITYGGYNFLVKKVDFANRLVYFGIKGYNFTFNDFAITNPMKGSSVLNSADHSAMTSYNNRIWIHSFGDSSEYKPLLQAAVANSIKDWYLNEPETKEVIEVSRFVPLCCDIPEIAETSFVLWYVF